MSDTPNCTGCFLVASPYLADGHFFRAVVFIVRHTSEGAFGVVINRVGEQRFSEVVEMSDPTWQKSSSKSSSKIKSSKLVDTASDLNLNEASFANPSSSSNDQLARSDVYRDWIHIGGPVDGPLLALHNIAGIGEPCGIDDESDSHGTQAVVNDHPAESFGSMSIQWADVPAWMTADEDHLRLLSRREDAKLRFIVGYSGWGAGQLDDELEAGGWLVTPAEAESIFGNEDDVWEKLVKRCGHAILKDLRPDLAMPAESESFDPGMN
ncbi:YqgE/AlgH family protein [Neorhodopirellula pilleata]|uniref:Uncharacterized protein n=1 Tax=Neorhodopirellula pilleata TaxID=2714738 RepID=A0A5C5ZPK5_9BACT|nr:YqgE/AlgH family protein [Neorhodopirellula pilleata]TWT89399.1 hypothetical protein Pla100_55620 [Neorhodopirellula pilleata]